MAKKKTKNKVVSMKYKKFTISGGKIERKPACPKCGPGTFLALHKDRQTCGKCGYTVFNKRE
ncbi:MAG: 30S ribosomal protein S27ae [Nanoarchaeota archaeon]|nr:30S ribosomal protein S27ae [Nanoarchaeota archaeon]MBU4241954.1 30S ribosomal protein S27ae [Nanoarchaeota archaeon]MBU4352205.1 30S ribosomal protein S27ae [Nanoarchaeota archaeon]MBU4456237.1 30S ribosomal protein S27ae [Nanoarchaeota archaeon]MCG2719373.1 30S ribosomal protein S27ae [Nanoarchaeota archaeon]